MSESRDEPAAQEESRRRFKMMLFIGLLLSFMGTPTVAQYGAGSGSAEDPYLIFAVEQMISISQRPGDWDKHFRLMEDLDLSGMDLADYTPIGFYTVIDSDTIETPFRGVFDGNDHTITGFSCRTSYIAALFGIVDGGAQIRNVGLIDPNVEGTNWVGALVGQLKQATVTRCTVQGGRVSGPMAIPASIVNVGGLVGSNFAGTVADCHATCDVPAGSRSVGGLVGANAGMISGCFSTSQVSGKDRVAGLVGANDYIGAGTIMNSYATGSVTGERVVGGLVGINPGTICQCYAMGRVSGLEDVGGCIGKNQSTGASRTTGIIIACFWSQDTSGQIFSDGGFGKSSDEMQDLGTYLDAGWDFVDELGNGSEDIWCMEPGMGAAPRLAWEPDPQLLLSFNLDENPGWIAQGQWQFGQPQGLGGTEHGHPDPNAGYTGKNVYGVNLAGDYDSVQPGLFYLTTKAIDCSAYRRVGLQFARWLNTDQADFVQASVEVSNDGSTWHTVWAYADTEADRMDDAWRMVCYDISSFADGYPTVYISWGYGILAQDAWPFSGWNIDDVSLVGLK